MVSRDHYPDMITKEAQDANMKSAEVDTPPALLDAFTLAFSAVSSRLGWNDAPSERTARTVHLHDHVPMATPGAPTDEAALMAHTSSTYQANIPPAEWDAIKDFVREAVADSDPNGVIASRNVHVHCAKFVHWAWSEAGLPLDRDEIFRPAVIDNFIEFGFTGVTASTLSTYRGSLYRMAGRLQRGPDRQMPRRRLSRGNHTKAPYNTPELAQLELWATRQKTDYRTFNATLVLCVTLGAGLRASEVLAATTDDVVVDEVGVCLRVRGERQRVVPVLDEWSAALRHVAENKPDEAAYLLSPRRRRNINPGLLSAFIEDCGTYGLRPNPQRLRCTWIVRHLNSGIHAATLARIAGLADAGGFTKYWQFANEPAPEAARELLHGRTIVTTTQGVTR